MGGMFTGCGLLKRIEVSEFNTEKVTNMGSMFSGCQSLEKIDLSSFDTRKVKKMGQMFGYCRGLKELKLNNFNTENVTDMNALVGQCTNLKYLDISNSFVIKDEVNYSNFFYGINLNSLKIKSSQNTANKLKALYSKLTDNNFEICN